MHEEIAAKNVIESKGHKLVEGDFAILSNYLILHILNIILLWLIIYVLMNSPLLIPLRKLNPAYNDHLSKSTTFSQFQQVVDLTGFTVNVKFFDHHWAAQMDTVSSLCMPLCTPSDKHTPNKNLYTSFVFVSISSLWNFYTMILLTHILLLVL